MNKESRVFQVEGQLVDIEQDSIYPARLTLNKGRIERISKLHNASGPYLLPGLVDAHVHVESSMLPPAEFARMAVVQGTIASVSDPHEIANVLGEEGVLYMLEQARLSPFKFCFGAPSCVPATVFENAGAVLDAEAVARLLALDDIGYLAEVMNFPGVLAADPDLLAKIEAAKKAGKPVDGHAPGLRGAEAARYAAAGISTDHECVSIEEALDKLQAGMHILIREGSAAKNFEALWPLLKSHPERVMLCSDDKHPNDLVLGHINQLMGRAIAKGVPLPNVLRAACINPVHHYRLPLGQLRPGDAADLIAVEDLKDFKVLNTWIDGREVARQGKCLIPAHKAPCPNRFAARNLQPKALQVIRKGKRLLCIKVQDGQLVTGREWVELQGTSDAGPKSSRPSPESQNQAALVNPEPERDLLKLVVLNRYREAPPAIAFVKGFGLKRGALASTVAHDSHNIIAAGCSDEAICQSINALVESGGGISVADENKESSVLPLPIAGLMSDLDGWTVAERYEELDARVKALGSSLSAPFMSLSFLALLVIPSLKLSDLGLFDGDLFRFCDMFDDGAGE